MSCLTTHGIGRNTRLPSSTIRNHRTLAQARHDAFTLVELLVVISIIALLIAILLPALRQARQAAYMAGSLSNIRQLTLAQHLYADDNDGSLPFHTFRTHLPDVGGGITANVPPWTQAMLQMGYIQGDARAACSGARAGISAPSTPTWPSGSFSIRVT